MLMSKISEPVLGVSQARVIKDNVLETSDGKFVGKLESIPSPSATYASKMVQYTGTTNSDFTHGYFYECLLKDGNYVWVNVETSKGGNGELSDTLTVTKTTGGIQSGKIYQAGTDFETMWRDMLNPVENPTFTAPSATLSVSGNKLLETGTTVSKTFTIVFNRGAITPAYGTSGYRSGVADGYSLNGSATQSSNTFTSTVSESNKTFQGSVSYEAGEQPKNSAGGNYSTPLPAGSVNTNTITYEFVDAIWSNASNNAVIAKEALVSKSLKTKEFQFAASTASTPETFDVPSSWTVTGIAVLNELSGKYEDCSSEFDISNTTHEDAAGNVVNYKRYQDNRGYASGQRQIELFWS